MKVAVLSLLAMLALPCAAGADTLQPHAWVNLHARNGSHARISQDSSRQDRTWKAFRDAIRNCEIVRNSFGVPVECTVSDFQSHPTVVLVFLSAHSMDVHSDIVVERLIGPFCAAYTRGAVPARVVAYARDTRLVSVFGCDTGTFSAWARLTIS